MNSNLPFTCCIKKELINCSIKRKKKQGKTHQDVKLPSPVHTWKLDADASWLENLQRGGFGWMLRNWSGKIVIVGCTCVREKRSIKFYEAIVIQT